eukprot:sb/3460869/
MSKRPITDLQSDDDSDVDLDEEFSEDELDEVQPKKSAPKKSKFLRITDFIQDEAEVDDDADDLEEDDDLEEGYSELVKEGAEEPEDGEDAYSSRMRLQHIMDIEEEDKIEQYYRNKYAEVDDQDVIDTSGYAKNEEVKQQSALPGVKDPRLWQVKCRIGEEKATAIKLMRKFINLEANNDPLQIKSVVVPVGVKGCIYIEAYKQTHVKATLAGVNALGMGKWQQPMVPINEMPDVLKVVSEPLAIKQNSWVRIKRGIYRDDLAQIDYVENNQNKALCKLIPRIDYKKVKAVYKDGETVNNFRRSAKGRPSQRIFKAEEIRALGGELKKDGDFIIFESNRYRNGFLYKTLSFSGISIDGQKPTVEELKMFDEQPDNVDPENLPSEKKLTTDAVFAAGDVVEVSEGELIHMTGTIISIAGDKVTIVPNHADLANAGALEFPAKELRKIFKEGDHVKVINGSLEGETGVVVRVDDNIAVLVADKTLEEFKVRPRDLQLCTEMNSGVDSHGMYQIGDVIEINQSTVGYIVRIERESVKVLTQYGKTESVNNRAIMRKLRCGQALDSQQNFLKFKDIVDVNDDKKRRGEIKFIWRHFLFLFNRGLAENGGIFVAKSRGVTLPGANKSTGSFVAASPRLQSPSRSPMRAGGEGGASPRHSRGGGRGGKSQRDREFIGKTVKVKTGPYKGYVGIVRDSTDTTARIELHTDCKIISVERGHLAEVTTLASGGHITPSTPFINKTPAYTNNLGGATPVYGAQGSRTPMQSGNRTPMYGSQTPSRGDRTPYYGAQTPTHDGNATPRAGYSAWDPNCPNTPARSSSDDFNDYYENSPSPAPFSPANPQTPGYGEPMTPGYAIDSMGPATPGTDYNTSSAPSPASPYTEPSPSPGESSLGPPSPGSDSSVPTPYSNMASPMTPASTQENWPLSGIEVVMLESFEDGQYIGQTGYIRAVSGPISTVWLYEEEREFALRSSRFGPGTFSCIGDVIEINQSTVGYIVRIERESVKVLTQYGKTESVNNRAIMRKLRCGQALDSQQNFLKFKDIVDVNDDKKRRGEIKFIWRHFLFLFNRGLAENGGIFVAKSRGVTLPGANKSTGSFVAASPRLQSPSRSPMRAGGEGGASPRHSRGGGRGGKSQRDREFIGKTVKVKTGPYKGYVGIVRDSTDTTARIELHTDCKIISVERGHLAEVTTLASGGHITPSTPFINKTPAYTNNLGGATPVYGAQGSRTPMQSGNRTPMYGSQTPSRGDRTPYYGAQTPTHDGNATPRAGYSAWDPNCPNTPARSSSDDFNDYYENSPSPAPFSPANPQTPGYGEPMTPGYAIDSMGPATPGTDYNTSSAPSPASPYTEPSPSPGESSLGPPSPGSDSSVPTPYSNMASPMTPASTQENWPLSGIEVVMLESFEDGQYIGQTGYIRAVSGPISTVWLYEEEREFECQSYQMKPVVPKKQDKVVIITGNRRGNHGQLINIDNDDGIVKADKSLELRILKLDSLAKLSAHHM